MPLPTSGTLTLAQIQTEFGGADPISLNEYYAGGANVPAGTSGTNGAVPSSGTISISNFYGTAKATTFTATISSNQDRLNLRSWALSNGWNGTSQAIITLASGVWIYSSTTATPALTIDGSWAGGLTFINNGYVIGMGGNGGAGGGTSVVGSGGGTGITVSTYVTIQNNSNIGGGGGGGGGGGSGSGSAYQALGGGGGGGGRTGLSNSSGGAGAVSAGGNGNAGGSGTSSSQGGGGGGKVLDATHYAGNGGSGGAWGATGSAGTAGTYYYGTVISPSNGASGGGGGLCVSGNGYITWSATGNRYGGLG